MNEINVNQLLVQMRAMAEKTQGLDTGVQQIQGTSEFSKLLESSVNKVNELQKTSADLTNRFQMGDSEVKLTEVMINAQKASLSFQAMTQVRNRLVSAYQEVMNMQI